MQVKYSKAHLESHLGTLLTIMAAFMIILSMLSAGTIYLAARTDSILRQERAQQALIKQIEHSPKYQRHR